MARTQFTFTFRNAEPGAAVTFSAAVYSSPADQVADGPTLWLDSSRTVAVWADVTELTATWVDGTGTPVAAEASVAVPVVIETGGTTGATPTLNADLTAIAALDSATAGTIASDGAGWIKKTYAQFKTALSLVKGDVGLGSVDNTADTAKPVSTAQATAIAARVGSVTAADSTVTVAGTATAPTVKVAKALDSSYLTDFTSAVGEIIGQLDAKQEVAYATAAALPANAYLNGALGVGATLIATSFGALSVDGQAVSVGQRVLVKNEATPANNGIYVVTATGGLAAFYTLTRAADYNQAAEIGPGDLVPVAGPAGALGATNDATVWVSLGPVPFVVGTSSVTFSQVGASSGGSVPVGTPTVKAFAFTHATAGLNNGVTAYTPEVGEILFAAWVQVIEAWTYDGVGHASFDVGQFIGETYGWFGYGSGNPNLEYADTQGVLMPFGLNTQSDNGGQSATSLLLNFLSANNKKRGLPTTFEAADPVKVIVSHEGTKGGAAITSATGSAVLYLLTASNPNS